MENKNESVVATFDFGLGGSVSLTPTRLVASLKGETTVASATGIKTGVNEELRVKLDQLKNLGILPCKSMVVTIAFFLLFWWPLPIFCPLAGFVFGLIIGAAKLLFWVGMLLGVVAAVWVFAKTPKMMRKFRCTYLIFSTPEGSNVSIPCEVSRISELETFVQTARNTQREYMDAI